MPTDTTPFDTFAQITNKLALSPSGETHTEDKISVNARRIDFWFRADPTKAPAPGILGKMTGHGIHILEFYHQPPGLVLWRECMQKQMALYTRESGEFPTLWVISGGRPDTLIEDVELRKSKGLPQGLPKGFYETAPGYRARLVVTSELPEIRETLLLRLWSAGKTLKRAQAELRLLPQDAWEWQVVREAVVALAGTPLYAENQEGLAMIEDYRKVVDAWKEEVENIGIAKGEAIGIAKGEAIGIAKGEAIGEQRALHEALEAIYTSRFGVLPESLRHRLQEIQTVDRLRVLIGVFVSRPQGELDALIQG